MSAIAGIYHANDPVSEKLGLHMMQALEKFPADDIQIWHKHNMFLGCHNQWITPESIGEQVPFHDHARQLIITADAMIDNRKELFDKLDIHHEERKLMTDNQLILLAYAKWEDAVVQHLIGDFAFMIWDEKKQKLFGARDFSGTRSLYYSHSDQHFAFCTVMEPLFSLPYVKRELNEEWLAEFLAIPNLLDAVDVVQTAIKAIQQVPPSHTISCKGGKVLLEKYEIISMDKKIRFKKDEEYIEAFRHIFQEAVDSRLRTFKEVGSTLSGGLDSGAVVSFAAKPLLQQNKKLHTYSSVPAKDFQDYTPRNYLPDERPLIKETVSYVGNIKAHYLSLDDKNPYTDIDDWLELLEAPYKFFENTFWIKGIFEQANKDNIGILLSGARGNFTISWGHAMEYYEDLFKRMRWIQFVREINAYSKNIGVGRKRLLKQLKQQLFSASETDDDPFPMLINPEFAQEMNIFEKLNRHSIGKDGFINLTMFNEREFLLNNEFNWNLSGITNSKLSLQNGLAYRDPTDDIRIINYCMALPLKQFINNGMDRALIRNATKGYLPDKVRLNQKYYGLQGMDSIHRMTPYWSVFIDEVKQVLNNKAIERYLNKQVIYDALAQAIKVPTGHFTTSPEYKILMRSVIIARFLQSFDFKGGDQFAKEMESTKIGVVGY